MFFYWDTWNREHIARHGIGEEEADFVVRHLTPPDPIPVGDGKFRVWGPTRDGRLIQVIYSEILMERIRYEELELEDILALDEDRGPFVYVIHARDLTDNEKRLLRRRNR